MKIRLILSLIILGLFYACEKDPIEELDTFLVIGNENATIRIIDTLIFPEDRYDSIVYKIDIDLNGTNDVAFYIFYDYSPSHYRSNFRFDCLTDQIKVLTNDSILSPEILDYGDTLNIDKKWVNSSMEILRTFGNSVWVGDGIIYKYGNWYDLSNKYIGVLIEDDENPTYGWIKLSVPDGEWVNSLTIHEIGHKKAAYNTP
ncbi:MAG: hypothetical protein GQ525_06865 [Draconibacterium sp.]|nr:hypothetical protein [Draconibacterium sp.]